jgi:hypothetical protein
MMMAGSKIGLLLVLSLFQSTSVKPGTELLGFTLNQTPLDVVAQLGPPDGVDDSLPNYVSWLFRGEIRDERDYSYIVCFRRSDNRLVSITRNFERDEIVDHLFPGGESAVRNWPSDDKPQFSVRIRALSGGRLLIAMGSGQPRKPCGQLVLIDREMVPFFFPWLTEPGAEKTL